MWPVKPALKSPCVESMVRGGRGRSKGGRGGVRGGGEGGGGRKGRGGS